MDRGAWWAAFHGVARSRTRLSDFTFTFHFHALEEEMATHSSVLAWRIPWTEEPGGLLSMGSHRVRHNWSDLAAAAIFLNSFLLLTLVFVSYFFIPSNVYLHSLFSIFISWSPVSLWTSFTVSIFFYLQVFFVHLDLFINTLIVYKHVIYCGYVFFFPNILCSWYLVSYIYSQQICLIWFQSS